MEFLADENIPFFTVQGLRRAGHDVAAVATEAPGISDEDVLARTVREKRVLLTFDSDYGGLLYAHATSDVRGIGIVYFRFAPRFPTEPAELLLSLLGVPDLELEGYLTVAERERIRQRPLPTPSG